MSEFAEQIKNETKQMCLQVIYLTRKFPDNTESKIIKNQLIRSATSVAANYRSACRARSNKDFLSKLSVSIEELDESIFWIEVATEIQLIEQVDTTELMLNMNKLVRILSASKNSMKKKIAKP